MPWAARCCSRNPSITTWGTDRHGWRCRSRVSGSVTPAKWAVPAGWFPVASNGSSRPRWSNASCVRDCTPPASDNGLRCASLSAKPTETPASRSSLATVIPVGPAPTTSTSVSMNSPSVVSIKTRATLRLPTQARQKPDLLRRYPTPTTLVSVESDYDELDRRLVHALQIDGRAPFSAIADVLGVSDRTVARRYARPPPPRAPPPALGGGGAGAGRRRPDRAGRGAVVPAGPLRARRVGPGRR